MRSILMSLSLVVSLAMGDQAWACSAFSTVMDGDRVVAKNFDWFTGEGFLVVNQRDRVRDSFLSRDRSWTAKYGSVSLTIIGPGFPVSGMNEKGLVVESLVNYSASATTGSAPLASLEWVQFALDRYATVEELRASLQQNAPTQMVVPLHFFACDAGGECMVVEPDGDRLAVIAGKKLAVPIVANRAWREDYRDAKAHAESMWERLTTPGFQSHARYSTIYRALRGKERMSRPEVFETLEDARISQINRWQIVWNQDRGQATYRIRDDDADGTFRRLSLDKMDFRCTEDIRVQELKVSSSPWRDFAVADRAVIEGRVKQLVAVRSGRVPRGFAAAVAEHTQTSRCARKTAGR